MHANANDKEKNNPCIIYAHTHTHTQNIYPEIINLGFYSFDTDLFQL